MGGKLSFVVNAGYAPAPSWGSADTHHRVGRYDWPFTSHDEETPLSSNVDNNELATFSTGVFWREVNSTRSVERLRRPKAMTLDYVFRGDGAATTVLLSENLSTTRYIEDGAAFSGGWGSHLTPDIAFMLSVKSLDEATFAGINTALDGVGLDTKETGLALATTDGSRFRMSGSKLSETGASRINANVVPAHEGKVPRPSSLHPGAVNFIFCDGRGRAITQKVDDQVYANLLSTDGGGYGQPIIGTSDF